MDEKVNKLMELLEPCLKKEEIKGSWKYNVFDNECGAHPQFK